MPPRTNKTLPFAIVSAAVATMPEVTLRSLRMSSVEPLAQLGPTSEPDLAVDKATASAFVVRRYQSVDSLPPQFGPLFERAEAHSFDLSLDWFRHLCATALKADESVQLFTAESQASGESLAVMGFRQEAGTRQLRALATFYS